MQFIYLILISTILLGCAAEGPSFNPKKIDQAFTKYLETYVDHKGSGIGNINITFASLKLPLIGVCWIGPRDRRHIQIDPEVWFNFSESDRIILLFHELGHCDLDRRHAQRGSIMNTYHLGETVYDTDVEYYISELFDPSLNQAQHSKVKGGEHGERNHDTCGSNRVR